MICPYCNNRAVLISTLEFYGKDYGTNMWICNPCDTRVGTRGGTSTPLGTLANAELRQLRMECHKRFDVKWKKGYMSRTQAYAWLQRAMGMTADEAHIGCFREEQCLKLLEILP